MKTLIKTRITARRRLPRSLTQKTSHRRGVSKRSFALQNKRERSTSEGEAVNESARGV